VQAEILILSNGPGELASWVRPVVRQLSQDAPGCRVTVALTPCPYASGDEQSAIAHWPERVNVWSPETTMGYLLWGRKPEGFAPEGPGAVLFLGGDQLFGAILSLRTGYPLLTYTETEARWRAFTRRFLVSDRNLFLKLRDRHLPAGQLRMVGNLMVDAVRPSFDPIQARRVLGLRPDALVLGLLPGSKPFKVRYVTPLFLRVAELLQSAYPQLQVVLHRSPFTPREQLVEAIESERYRAVTGGVGGRLEREGTIDWIYTPGGGRVQVVPPELHTEGLAVADVALTVPGTNTAELAILGVPMVVALPLHKPEEIPIDGLVGQLGRVPAAGPWLKRFLARQVEARRPLVALPNQRAGRMVTPELIGAFTPDRLAQEVSLLLADSVARRDIKLELHTLMGAPGAARAVVDALTDALRQTPTRREEGASAPQPKEPSP
jgi:lipid-A-disaccharide synthase